MTNISPGELDGIAYLWRNDFFLREMRAGTSLTYDDVSLATNFSRILPSQANVSTRIGHLVLPTPIISADMDTVTEADMAIAMAMNGGLGIVHYNMPPDEQISQIAKVKNYMHGINHKPITISPDKKIGEIIQMRQEKWYKFGTFPVLSEWKLVGLIGSSVLNDMYAERKVQDVMTKREDILTITPNQLWSEPIKRSYQFFTENPGKNKLLIVDDSNVLKWLITLSDIQRISQEKSNSTIAQDSSHRLLVWAALHPWRTQEGVLDENKIRNHIEELLQKWVDSIALSSAHAHTESMGELIKLTRQVAKDITIIAWNVTSANAVEFLAESWVNVIKVWQGPGSICTTREVAGVWIPQLSAVAIASMAAEQLGVQIIADGGITKSGSIVKAFAAWADAVMLWGLLGATNEAPWEIFKHDWKLYKVYRGMWSSEAMQQWSAARYGHTGKDAVRKATAEWVSAATVITWPVSKILQDLVGWIQSGMWYLGASHLAEIREKARFTKMTWAGGVESRTHDIIKIER
jgi:IMP dehydrogenase